MLDFGENKSVLVIVPHEDDEINLMGGLLPLLVEKNMDVNICFVTNGDFEVPGELRIAEAISALQCLGISSDKVFFLGYPDASNKVRKSLYGSDDIIESKRGTYTYGSELRQDFRMLLSGKHSPYTYSALKKDIIDIILFLQPDLIFCSDMDPHHDHKLVSLAFEEAIEDVLKQKATYIPFIFKGFAYSTSYDTVSDLFKGMNILPTQKPDRKDGKLDNPLFSWEDRVRFPVSERVLDFDKTENVLVKAIFEHKSQFFAKRVGSVINSDVIFWRLPIKNRKVRLYKVEKSCNLEAEVQYKLIDDIGYEEPIKKPLKIAKLLLNDGFAYRDYFIYDENNISCCMYTEGISVELKVETDDRSVLINEGNVYLPKHVKNVQVFLKDGEGNILDVVRIVRMSLIDRVMLEFNKWFFRLACYIEYKKEKRYRKALLGK